MKRKILQTVLILASTMIVTACSTTPKTQGDVKQEDYVQIEKKLPLKEIHKLIAEAGEEAGWRITEFKENALIAEKFDGDESKTVTIDFSTTSFHLTPQDDELESVIEDKLNP